MSSDLRFEPLIGLEVHAQLKTRSKMFCACSADYSGAPPNTHTCPICAGMPGALPVVNARAVEYGLRTALALECRVAEQSKFDRKNYSYPDLPKGYQISQYDQPIGTDGWLEYRSGDRTIGWGIIRVHLEEDTGKTLHTQVAGAPASLVDLNRSGVPLMEIVTTPEVRTPQEARDFFASLRQVLMYLGVCDGNLQEGSLRADVNVSVAPPGSPPGTKVEIKNLNSFRALERALEFEIDRQSAILRSGGSITQETRGWSEKDEVTVSQRTKEYAHDYRYFPEPDLPPLIVTGSSLDTLRQELPELPATRLARLERELHLATAQAEVLTQDRALADYFEHAVNVPNAPEPRLIANWMTGDLLRLLNESGSSIGACPVSPADLSRLVAMVASGEISGAAGKQILEEAFRTGETPEAVVERLDLRQLGDVTLLESLVDDVISANPHIVETYRKGKTNAIQALVGKTMGASKGKANPAQVLEILRQRLG